MGITGVYQQETDHYYLKKNGAKDRKFTDFEKLIAAIRKAQANRKVKYLKCYCLSSTGILFWLADAW
jgi:hypothetical protein